MDYRRQISFSTPRLIKVLSVLSLLTGVASAFFHSVKEGFLFLPFRSLFAFSFSSFCSGRFWQPLTFLFLPQVEGPLSFYFLFTLSFDIYLFWLLACRVYRLLGRGTLLKLFFIFPALSGITALFIAERIRPGIFLQGNSHVMIPLVVAFCFADPYASMDFLPAQPLRIKWLGIGLILLYLLQDLSDLNPAALISHLLLFSLTYFYMIFAYKMESPFSFTHRFDRLFIRKGALNAKIIPLLEKESRMTSVKRIFDKIRNGQKLSFFEKILLKLFRKKNKTNFPPL